MIGRLIDGLEDRGAFEDVTVIMVGGPGMLKICQNKAIFLVDVASWIEISANCVHSYSPLLAIWPPASANLTTLSDFVELMNQGL